MKVPELREIARSRGLKGWYRLRKSDLISFIITNDTEREAEEQRRQDEDQQRQREAEELESQRQQEQLEKTTEQLRLKAERKSKSKARRRAKRKEAKREAERRAEVRKVESNQRKQRAENVTGERPSGKETKSQRKRRQRLERQAEEAEKRLKICEQAQKKKNPKKARKEAKRKHRATKKEERRKLVVLQQQRLAEPATLELVSTSLNGNVCRWFVSGEGYKIPDVFLNSVRDGVRNVVDGVDKPIKTYAVLKCNLVKHNLKTKEKIFTEFNGRSDTHTITTELGNAYEEMKEKMLESLSKYQKEGSAWQLHSIIELDISVAKFNPLNGAGHSKLPLFIAKKKAVINMKNDDDQCFKWAVIRALNMSDDHPERITKELKDQAKKYDWSGITFPTKVKDISVWEKNNENKIKINVFGYDEDTQKVYTIRMHDGCASIVLGKEDNKFISLFLHDDNHYCVVKNIGRLVSSQYNNHQHKKHFCLNCMNGFGTDKILVAHQEVCLKRKPQNEVFPNPGETTKFKNYERLHDVPSSVYADFESFIKPIQHAEQDPSKSFTNKYQNHVPSGFCYVIKCMDKSVYPTKTVLKTASHEGEDMGKLFVETLSEDLRPIYEILKTPKPIIMTDSEKNQHKKSDSCYACGIKFGTTRVNEKTKKEEKVIKCADHG